MTAMLDGSISPDRAGTPARSGVWLTELLLTAMAVIWGVNYIVAKFGAGALAPLAFNSVRVGIACIALFAIVAVRREPWPRRGDAMRLVLLGALGNGLYQLLFIEGLARTRAGTAALILAAGPAIIALIGRALGVERISRKGMLGIALSIAGVALVLVGAQDPSVGGRSSLGGGLLVLGGCVCWALYTVLLQPLTHRVTGLQISALTMLGGAVPLALLAIPQLVATPWPTLGAKAWAAIAYSGIGALVIAYLFFYRGVRVLGPTRTAMFGNLQPAIALAVAWLVLGEIPTVWQLVGTASIMSGILLTRP